MQNILEKIRPSKKQLEFLSWEFGLFFHFGIRTFHPGFSDWDMREMSLDAFCPNLIDCDEWLASAKQAGAKYAIMTAKHHDGFANWPSKYTEFSVKNVPWMDGKGDVVRLFTDACRKHGLKVGIYYSPADYSAKNDSVTAREFEDYFIAQISELLTDYGKIDYLWFDGCGSENLVFDKARIIKAIRTLQPEILIFNMWDPDVRWIGNEEGYAPIENSGVVDNLDFSVMTDKKEALGSKMFLPAECDMRMRESHWFTADDSEVPTIKSVEKLMEIYDCSVGRGANLLLNIGPAATGRLPIQDKKRLLEFGDALAKRFANPVASCEGENCLAFNKNAVNTVVIEEDITDGEGVYEFEILADGVSVYGGKTIGHKAICKFKEVVCKHIEIKVTKGNNAKIKKITAFYCK